MSSHTSQATDCDGTDDSRPEAAFHFGTGIVLAASATPKYSPGLAAWPLGGWLGTSAPTAHCWPSGEVFVSRGLMDLLNDEQLAAAVAHEVGHLQRDGRLQGVASLRGRKPVVTEAEDEADALGVNKLLRTAGLPPESMAEMLKKVRDAADLSPPYHEDMSRRIARLNQARATAVRR